MPKKPKVSITIVVGINDVVSSSGEFNLDEFFMQDVLKAIESGDDVIELLARLLNAGSKAEVQ